MKGHQTRVTVRPAILWYSIPTDGGKHAAGSELKLRHFEKPLLDVVRHPIP